MICRWHLCENVLAGRQKGFCSTKCKSKFYVTRYRHKVKQKAVDLKGGKCQLCGYNKCNGALEFHHIDAPGKEFGISGEGLSRSWKRVEEELKKCILVCSNCHCEIHSGLAQLVEQTAVNGEA